MPPDGSDAEVDCGGEGFLVAGGFVGVGSGAQIVVDVERIYLLLAIDSRFIGVAAAKFDESPLLRSSAGQQCDRAVGRRLQRGDLFGSLRT